MYGRFGLNKIDDRNMLAVFLGHTAVTGGYLSKMAAMRAYGLITGRGFVQVSELGKRIAHPEKPDDPHEAVKDAITSIPLWRALYDKYTSKGVELPDVDFWVDLQQIAELVPDEAKKASKNVRKDYLDDVQYLYSLKGVKSGGQKVPEPNPIDNNQAKPSTLEELKFGDSVRIWLPKENIKDAWTKAKRMIDIYLGVEKKKEES